MLVVDKVTVCRSRSGFHCLTWGSGSAKWDDCGWVFPVHVHVGCWQSHCLQVQVWLSLLILRQWLSFQWPLSGRSCSSSWSFCLAWIARYARMIVCGRRHMVLPVCLIEMVASFGSICQVDFFLLSLVFLFTIPGEKREKSLTIHWKKI